MTASVRGRWSTDSSSACASVRRLRPLSIVSGRVIDGLDGWLDGFAGADGVRSAAVDDRRDVLGVVGA